MKDLLAVVLLVAVILLMGIFAFDEYGPDVQANSYQFTCANNYQFTITYRGENNERATLEIPTETYIITRARSASGARYTDIDESVVFWEHQGEATIAIDGEEVGVECVPRTNL